MSLNLSAQGLVRRADSLEVTTEFPDHGTSGTSSFHRHRLNREDKGMMARILFK
jgi:hypothetical protein